MNDYERRIRELINPWSTKFSNWWSNSSIRSALTNRSVDTAELRRQASAQAQRAATAMKDMRDSDTAKKAATAMTDLRQREPVRKAEESAKRVLHDLRSGHNGGDKS
jgi:hypothetical protein